jgi:hypothetical protein
MRERVQPPTLEEFIACCRAEFEFLVSEYGFEQLAEPREYNDFSVRFRKGELEVQILGENWGESASCELVRGKDELYLGFLVPRPDGHARARKKSSPGQLEQIRTIAVLVRSHASDFLRGEFGRYDAALAEWRRMTAPRPITEAHREERRRALAVSSAGHASRRGDHAEVVRLLEPHANALSARQKRMLDDARQKLGSQGG